MGKTPDRIGAEIEWERWRLRNALIMVTRAQDARAVAWDQSIADMALAALVKLGCDPAEELRQAKS